MKVKLKNLLVTKSTSIGECMQRLNATAEKCLIVTDNKKILLGTITDGDIRRSILNDFDIKKSIKDVYFKNPASFVKGNYKKTLIKKILQEKNISLVPLVNKKKIVVGYLTWDDIFKDERKIEVLNKIPLVIMAGGKGTRMEPFTKIFPKALLPVKEKPIIQHIIEKFALSGINKFFVTVNYKTVILKSFFSELNLNYSINFIHEKKPLGTAGSLRLLKNKIFAPFFVTNCDVIINVDYDSLYKFHLKNKNDLTLVASNKQYQVPYGVCQINKRGSLHQLIEKPKHDYLVNAGLYIMSPKVLNLIPKNKFFNINNLLNSIKSRKMKVGVYPISEESWSDVGQWSEYNKFFKSSK